MASLIVTGFGKFRGEPAGLNLQFDRQTTVASQQLPTGRVDVCIAGVESNPSEWLVNQLAAQTDAGAAVLHVASAASIRLLMFASRQGCLEQQVRDLQAQQMPAAVPPSR